MIVFILKKMFNDKRIEKKCFVIKFVFVFFVRSRIGENCVDLKLKWLNILYCYKEC